MLNEVNDHMKVEFETKCEIDGRGKMLWATCRTWRAYNGSIYNINGSILKRWLTHDQTLTRREKFCTK